ncbi:hypothetical protein BC830DRAFT_1228318 [Chytriomyces sp. MP71]|nr:hypothetical protein BC830DRAFT_1228318 [Chytriomyces sp. MP71]
MKTFVRDKCFRWHCSCHRLVIVIEIYTHFDYGIAGSVLPSYHALIARQPDNLALHRPSCFYKNVAITDPRVGLNPVLDQPIYSVLIPKDHVSGFSGMKPHVLRMKCYFEFAAKLMEALAKMRLTAATKYGLTEAPRFLKLSKAGTFQHFSALYEISEGKPWHAYVHYHDFEIAPYVYYVASLDEVVAMIEET